MHVDGPSAEVIEVVQTTLAPEVELGLARLETSFHPGGGWTVDVEPTNACACPVSVLAESLAQINLYIGQHPATATLELFDKRSRDKLLGSLHDLLRALADGRYEQTVEVKNPKTGRMKITGTFRLPERPLVHRYSGKGGGPFDQREKYTVLFEPY